MNKPRKVQELRVGWETYCRVRKADSLKLVHDAEGPYVDAVDYARESIGRGLRRDRLKAGLTQSTVAGRAGIRGETLSRIESGRGNPTVATLKAITRALGRRR